MNVLRMVVVVAVFVALGFELSLGPGQPIAQETNERMKDIEFLWAFGAMVKTGPSPRLIPITKDTTLKTGDQIKFFVSLEENCFVYLIYHSSQGEVSVLFPYRFEQLSRDFKTHALYYVPQGAEWFQLDGHVGLETFYLLASAERLHVLEQLINQYETADPAKKQAMVGKVLKEIRRLRRENRKFKTYAEKPVNIMGQFRGSEKVSTEAALDVAKLGMKVSAKHFYSRTFTIDHK